MDSETIHNTIHKRQVSALKRIIDEGNINRIGEDGTTPLLYAIEQKNFGIVKLLVSKGADVNKRGEYGVTPLYVAAREGLYDIAELLLKNDADPKIKAKGRFVNKDGYTAYEAAESNNHKKIMKLLEDYMPGSQEGGKKRATRNKRMAKRKTRKGSR
jgi:ankyrin repeat protein